jgi:hypothetical protein
MWVDGASACTAKMNPGCGHAVQLDNGHSCKQTSRLRYSLCIQYIHDLLIVPFVQILSKAVAHNSTCWMITTNLTAFVTSFTHLSRLIAELG